MRKGYLRPVGKHLSRAGSQCWSFGNRTKFQYFPWMLLSCLVFPGKRKASGFLGVSSTVSLILTSHLSPDPHTKLGSPSSSDLNSVP